MANTKTIQEEAVTLDPNECIGLLVDMYNHGIERTILFRGSPGIGKTSIAKQAAEILRTRYPDFHCVVVNPSTLPADEIGGIPDLVRDPNGGVTSTDYALPKWFPIADTNPQWRGFIVLDDALQGAGDIQKALANLTLARELRGYKLPKGAMVVVTGNRVEDKAGVARTLTHFADRMAWVNVKTGADQWIENFAVPNNLAEEVIAYIMRHKDEKLNQFDPNVEKCATPRTWAAVSDWVKYLNTITDTNRRARLAHSILSGELGQGEAITFWAFCKLYRELPNIADILADPEHHSIDYKIDVKYALAVAISQHIDKNTLGPALTYIDRIGPDMAALVVKMAMRRDRTITQSKAFVAWAVKNQDVNHTI